MAKTWCPWQRINIKHEKKKKVYINIPTTFLRGSFHSATNLSSRAAVPPSFRLLPFPQLSWKKHSNSKQTTWLSSNPSRESKRSPRPCTWPNPIFRTHRRFPLGIFRHTYRVVTALPAVAYQIKSRDRIQKSNRVKRKGKEKITENLQTNGINSLKFKLYSKKIFSCWEKGLMTLD